MVAAPAICALAPVEPGSGVSVAKSESGRRAHPSAAATRRRPQRQPRRHCITMAGNRTRSSDGFAAVRGPKVWCLAGDTKLALKTVGLGGVTTLTAPMSSESPPLLRGASELGEVVTRKKSRARRGRLRQGGGNMAAATQALHLTCLGGSGGTAAAGRARGPLPQATESESRLGTASVSSWCRASSESMFTASATVAIADTCFPGSESRGMARCHGRCHGRGHRP